MCEMLKLAKADYKAYQKLIEAEDVYVNNIAYYHMQQAIEKLLKCAVELKGEKKPWGHDIREMYKKYVDSGWPEISEIKQVRDTVTLWESNSRYSVSFSADEEDLQAAILGYKILEKYIEEYLHALEKPQEKEGIDCSKLTEECSSKEWDLQNPVLNELIKTAVEQGEDKNKNNTATSHNNGKENVL